jgi:hypothetical protein
VDAYLLRFRIPVSSILQPVDPNERLRLRRQEKRRQIKRRRLVASAVLIVLVAVGVVGAVLSRHLRRHHTPVRASAPAHKQTKLEPRPYPAEVRGVHVTMGLAGLPGKLDEYVGLARDGLNTIELDVKDENGQIAFAPGIPLARRVGAVREYYDPREVAARVHEAGLYLVGRVVTFEDPLLAAGDPALSIRRADGSPWVTNAGLGWTNPYDHRVWRYDVGVAEAAARAGFDEIQFDYVRFPSDGDVSQIRYPGRHGQAMDWTIPAFVKYAGARLHPLGVRVSTDVFGLAATRDLGIGQFPRRLARYVDTIYPMVYPSHFGPGEYGIVDPDSRPGVTVAYALRDFRRAVEETDVRLIPWLQDFSLGRTYTLADVRDEIQSARLEHVKGFMLWNAAGVYTDAALDTPAFR